MRLFDSWCFPRTTIPSSPPSSPSSSSSPRHRSQMGFLSPKSSSAPGLRVQKNIFFVLYLFLLVVPLVLAEDTKRKCYFPNGDATSSTIEGEYVPCSNDGVSLCCNTGHACLDNGLCWGGKEGLVSSECYDPASAV